MTQIEYKVYTQVLEEFYIEAVLIKVTNRAVYVYIIQVAIKEKKI